MATEIILTPHRHKPQGVSGSGSGYSGSESAGAPGTPAPIPSHNELQGLVNSDSYAESDAYVHLSAASAKKILDLIALFVPSETLLTIKKSLKIEGDLRAQNITVEDLLNAVRASFEQLSVAGESTLSNVIASGLSVSGHALFGSWIGSKNYLQGLSGWRIENDILEVAGIKVRGFIEVDEFRKNRITVINGETHYSSANGTVETADVGNSTIVLKLEKGEGSSFVSGDTAIGKWVSDTGSYSTCYLRVLSVDGHTIKYELKAGESFHPTQGMVLAQVGHPTDKSRQCGTIIRRNMTIKYDGVTGWNITPEHIYGLDGNIEGQTVPAFGELKGRGVYMRNAYIAGRISQTSYDGITSKPLPYDKGAWVVGSTAFYYDQVTHKGHVWLWDKQSTTQTEPSVANGWVDKGLTPEEAKRLAEDKVDNLQIGGENMITREYLKKINLWATESADPKYYFVGAVSNAYATWYTQDGGADNRTLFGSEFTFKEKTSYVFAVDYYNNVVTQYGIGSFIWFYTDGSHGDWITIPSCSDASKPAIGRISAISDVNKTAAGIRCTYGNGAMVHLNIYIGEGNKVPATLPRAKEDTQSDIAAAKKAGTDAASAVNDLSNNVNNFKNEVNTSFKDGLISESEAKAIEKYINVIKSDRQNAEATYAKVATSNYLEGQAKTDLLNAKISYFGAVDNLLSAVNTAISDGKTTVAEKQDVDAKYDIYRTAFALFSGALENANKAIQDKIKSLADTAVNGIKIGSGNMIKSNNYIKSVVLRSDNGGTGKAAGAFAFESLYVELPPNGGYVFTYNNIDDIYWEKPITGEIYTAYFETFGSVSSNQIDVLFAIWGNSVTIESGGGAFWSKHVATFIADKDSNGFAIKNRSNIPQQLYIKNVRLVKGNKISGEYELSAFDVYAFNKLAVRPNLVRQNFICNVDTEPYIANEVDKSKKHPASSMVYIKDLPAFNPKLKALILSIDINVTKFADQENSPFYRKVYFSVRKGDTVTKWEHTIIPKEVKKDRYVVVLPCTMDDIKQSDRIFCWLTDYGAGYINKTIENVKIEQVLEGEPEIPTTYIPHPDDLRGADGVDAVTSTVFFDGTYRNAYTTGVYANVRIYHKGEDVTSKADVKAFYEGIGNGATAFTTPSKIKQEFENRKRDGSDLHVWGTATYLGQTSYFDRRLRNIIDGDKGDNGHSLTVSAWFEGAYTDDYTSNVKLYAKAYYDGNEITPTWAVSITGGTTYNSAAIPIVFDNIKRNGQSFIADVVATHAGMTAKSVARLENNRKGDQGVAGWDGFSMPSEWDSTLAYPRTAVVWVKSGSDESNYQAKKEVPKGTPVSNTDFWQPINGFKASVFTEIWAKKLTVDAANIKNLTVNMIKAGKFDKSTFEVLPNGNIKIGQMLLNDAGELVGYDTAGKARMFINSRNISEINSIATNSSYNKTFTASSVMYSAVDTSGAPDRLTSFYIDTDMVDVHVTGSITVTKSAGDIGDAQLTLRLKSILYDTEYYLGTCISLSTSNTLTIDKMLPSCGHGNYELVAIWTYQTNGSSSVSTMSGKVNNITIQATKVTDLAQVVMGVDGFMAVRDGDNYFHYSRGNGLTVKGQSNIPGILAAGTVQQNGSVVASEAYGAYVGYGEYQQGYARYDGNGVYTVYHSIGHSDYTVQLTAESFSWGGSREAVIISWFNKTNNSFQVAQTNHSNNPNNQRFSYTVIGQNKG